MSLEKAEELVLKRIPAELFLAEQAFSIDQSIAQHASKLNNSEYKELFGLIQLQAFSSGLLSIGNLFERPSARYPNFSIPAAIAYLKADLNDIPLNEASKAKLAQYLSDDLQEQQLLILKPQRLKRCLLLELDEKCPKSPVRLGYKMDADFEAVKVLRDKRVAHYEDHTLAGLSTTDWDGIKRLLSYCESFINLVGYGLFGFSQNSWIPPEQIDFISKSGGQAISNMLQEISL